MRDDCPRKSRSILDGAEVVVIGAGASGLFAAGLLRGALVLERGPEPGRKIRVTGGGRCNLLHEGTADELAAAFGTWERFVRPAFRAFPPARQTAVFESLGLALKVEPGGFAYPASERAEDVRRTLLEAARAAGARIECGVRVERILLSGDGSCVRGVRLADGREIGARSVILAAGGSACPSLGTDGSAFALARSAGLDVVEPVPALGALLTDTPELGTLSGLTLPDAELRLLAAGRKAKGSPRVRGGLLITPNGLSGPAALNLCGDAATRLASGEQPDLRVSWRADRTSPEIWTALFRQWRSAHGGALVRNLLAAELPRSLAQLLCRLAEIPDATATARLRQDEASRLARLCADCPLPLAGTAGFAACMATRGGVACAELDPRTLASRRIAGLHCIGESVEPVGPCGGYNLSWAWASAWAAARGER